MDIYIYVYLNAIFSHIRTLLTTIFSRSDEYTKIDINLNEYTHESKYIVNCN